MNSERNIIKKLFENKMKEEELEEAGFDAGGSHYSCAFGNYTKDGEPISREEYFSAKGEDVKGGNEGDGEGPTHIGPDVISSALETMTKSLKNAKVNKYDNYDEITTEGGADPKFMSNLSKAMNTAGYKVEDYVSAEDSDDGYAMFKFVNKDKPEGQRTIKVYKGADENDLNIIIDKKGYLEDKKNDDTKSELRSFTKYDWMGYGGAYKLPSGKEPMICDLDNLDGKDGWEEHALIVSGDYDDETAVGIDLTGSGEGHFYRLELHDEERAIRKAKDLVIKLSKMTPDDDIDAFMKKEGFDKF